MGFSGKLIDFDDSYFSANPPKDHESLVGTPEYYSPEQAAYIMDEDDEILGDALTLKSDIFTLGIILCEYFTGKKPILSEGYSSTWSCVENCKPFSLARHVPNRIEELVRNMLNLRPVDRPNINQVFDILKNPDLKDDTGRPMVPPPDSFPKPRIRGKLVTKEKIEEGSTIETLSPSIEKSKLRSKTWKV